MKDILSHRGRHLVIRTLTILTALTTGVDFLLAAEDYVSSRQTRMPNVLLIVSDDLNTDLGCYGHPAVKTPNIDRLAARGMRFDHAYCQGPACNSSRASIFSGLRPLTTDVLDNESPWPSQLRNSAYMPAYFQQLGYFTATFGKILDHKRVPDQPYWDLEVREWGKYPEDDQILERGQFFPGSTGSMFWAKLKGPDEVTPDGEVARKAAKMLEDRAGKDGPFLAAVGFRRPHTPYAVPSKYFDLYPPEHLSLPEVPQGYAETIPPGAKEWKPFQGGRDDALRALAAYYACISYVDSQVGVLLETLDKLKLWDNTIIIFISDHGYHTGHNGRWHKGWLFEQTTLTPMIIAAPGRSPGSCQRVVELVDLYPTLAELCGQRPPAALEGASLVPLLKDPDSPWEKNALTTVGCLDADKRRAYVGHSVRTADYRYTEWDGGKQGIEFYALEDDPRGLRNLAHDSTYADTVSELQALLHSMCHSP